MNRIFFILLLCSVNGLAQKLPVQEDLSVFKYWNYYENVPSVSLYKHLAGKAAVQIQQRDADVSKLNTADDWQKRQRWLRSSLQKAVGPFPERTPLNAVISGTIERDNFKVEKLYFESRPGFRVTAAIFIPKNKTGPLPAIIYCSGHSSNGFRSAVYQRVILNYVKKGFVVFAFDPVGQGERIQYPDKKMNPVDEHSYPGVQSFISGRPPANYFIWDGIRAVDYLISRKEVDPARIGITGRSGGGTQSAYIAALDGRITAAAPECYITTFDKLIKSKGPQDAEQNLMYGLENGLDIADFLAVRAPKPALIIATTNDIFSIQGARDVYREVSPAYKAYGKAGSFGMTEDDAAHVSTPLNRRAAYAFFQKHLGNPGDTTDLNLPVFTDQELTSLPAGMDAGETIFSLNKKYADDLLTLRTQDRKSIPPTEARLRQKVISITGYQSPKKNQEAIFSGRIVRDSYTIEKYLVRGSGEYYLPVLWLKPNQASEKVVVLFDEKGKSTSAVRGAIADRLTREGIQVIVPDLSGIGELAPGFMKGGDSVIDDVPLNLWFTGLLTHKTIVAVRAEEIEIITDFVKRKIPPSHSMSAVGSGVLTSDLLHAAAIKEQFNKILLLNPLVSYQSIVAEKYYQPGFVLSAVPGSLASYDLPDLMSLCGKQQLLLVNPVKADGKAMQTDELSSISNIAVPANASKKADVRTGLVEEDYLTLIAAWIK